MFEGFIDETEFVCTGEMGKFIFHAKQIHVRMSNISFFLLVYPSEKAIWV